MSASVGLSSTTGRKEWAHLSAGERLRYIFSTAELGLLLMFSLFPGLLGYFTEMTYPGHPWKNALIWALWGIAWAAPVILFLWAIKFVIIRLSLRRHPPADPLYTGEPLEPKWR